MKEKPEILVADDDPSISQLVRLYLEKEGFAVRTAARGDQALEEFLVYVHKKRALTLSVS